MQGNPWFGKFGPLLLLAVVQLVIVLAMPSTAQNASTVGLGSPSGTTGSVGPTGTVAAPGTVTGPTGTGPAGSGSTALPGATGPGATGSTGSTGSTSTPGSTGTAASTTPTGPRSETDTSHCVKNHQFSQAIYYYAPPCVPGVPGAAWSNNYGATWQGVTGNTIEVVNYVADYGAEVDQILKAEQLYYDANQAKQWNDAYAAFISSHYQLYGRKLHVDTVEGNCQTVPPNYSCLVGDMDKIVATYHPYAVFWETTVCSQCFAELSRLHVVNFGGGGFSDAFHNANAPYSYDGGMSSTEIELQFADWWCHQMTSRGGTGRTAIFAGTANNKENFTHRPRVLGVVSTNDPDNENTVKQVLYPALQRGCGEKVTHQYFYAQDINTATTQSQQDEQAMNTSKNPATSVVCLCDPVAPQFGLNAYSNNNYWPESILATDQTMDFDSNGQTYASSDTSKDHLSCPKGNPCAFDGTIGLGSSDPQVAPNNTDAAKVYRAGVHNPKAPLPTSAATLAIVWNDWAMLATLIENTGPLLTPARMQAAAPQIPFMGGTGIHPIKGFAKNSWCWTKSSEVVYWNKHTKSPYNGVPGHYIQIEGRWFTRGQFPTLKQPPAPLPANRK